jgi:hypothetical protein
VTIRRLVIAIAFLSILFMASRPMVDTDTWWHLRTGQWILDHHTLSEADTFSFTRFGEPYYYPAWLSEILMAEVYAWGGLPTLNLFFTGLILLAYVLVFLTMEGDAFLTAVGLVLAAGASEVFWSLRPQLFTFLFGAFFYFCIRKFLSKNRAAIWFLPLVMLLWVNIHPGFIVGFILLGIAIAGQGIAYLIERRPRNPDTGEKIRILSGVSLVCLASSAVNPRGIAVWGYPFETVSIQFLQKFIQEWQSPDFHLPEGQLFLVFFLLTWAVIAFSPKALEVMDFLFLVVIGFLGFMAWRNIYLLSIVAPSMILRYGQPILQSAFPKWNPGHPVSRRQSAVHGALLILLSAAWLFWISSTLPSALETALRRQIPVPAVEYLSRHPDPGKVLNSYNWGSYLLWAVPARTVFIDGRTDLFGDEILGQYLTVVEAQAGWRDILSTWEIRAVFLEPNAPILQILLSEGWRIGFRDSQAVVLLYPDP